jgi:hypothetical protein
MISPDDTKLRHLVPELLAVSCERIKHEVFRELNIPESGGSKIYVTIRRNARRDQTIAVGATLYVDGWQYRLEFPEQVEGETVIRAIVQTLLLEVANRQARERSAEIPLWLAEGLTQHLLAAAEADLVLEPQRGATISAARMPNTISLWRQWGTNNEGIRRDLLFEVRRILSNHAPLSFTELSLPDATHFNALKWEVYKSCSQLLVHQLLSLPNGRSNVRAMLSILPRYLNWQTAFLRAFRDQFSNLLDVEKWWAVRLSSFMGRDNWQVWPRETCLEKLNAALVLPIQINAGTNNLPSRTEMSLPEIIRELGFEQQKLLLNRTLGQLAALRARMIPELLPLLNEYCQVLESYVQRRPRPQAVFPSPLASLRRGEPRVDVDARMLIEDTLRRLTSLNEQRQSLRSQENPPSITFSNTP